MDDHDAIKRFPLEPGVRFGNYILIERVPNDARRQARWRCRCDCGVVKVVRLAHLTHGAIVSCGCVGRRNLDQTTHGLKALPEYRVWKTMKERCRSRKHNRYPRYGGRGITVCSAWVNDFTAFIRDMGRRPSSKHSIERRDNDGNYEPTNCYWATAVEQRANRRVR